jgi:cytidylate kinase
MEQLLPRLPLHFTIEDSALAIFHREKRLYEELRRPQVSQWASRISQAESVRTFLTQWQRRLAAQGRIVAEGRDMTTVVFPDAPIKIFLTADLATRTQRRFLEYQQKGIPVDYSILEAQIRHRDEADQRRQLAPLRVASDAFYLDTSELNLEEVVNRIREFIAGKKNH